MTPVIRKEKFTVSLATKSYTYDVARFVVNQNIKHHTDCEPWSASSRYRKGLYRRGII